MTLPLFSYEQQVSCGIRIHFYMLMQMLAKAKAAAEAAAPPAPAGAAADREQAQLSGEQQEEEENEEQEAPRKRRKQEDRPAKQSGEQAGCRPPGQRARVVSLPTRSASARATLFEDAMQHSGQPSRGLLPARPPARAWGDCRAACSAALGRPIAPAGPRQYGPRVKKLQGICRAATIPIPPTVYSRNKGSEEALQRALGELLEKHGLDASAGGRDGPRSRAAYQACVRAVKAGSSSSSSHCLRGKHWRRFHGLQQLPLPQPASQPYEKRCSGPAHLGCRRRARDCAGEGTAAAAARPRRHRHL